MRTWVVGRIIPFALLLMALLTSCLANEKVPAMEDILPPNYEERRAPPELYKDVTGNFGKDLVWMRCFDCEYDWDGLNTYLAGRLTAFSFVENTDAFISSLKRDGTLPDDIARKMFKLYSSPTGNAHCLVMNVAYLRSLDSSFANTTGDHLVMVGYDYASEIPAP